MKTFKSTSVVEAPQLPNRVNSGFELKNNADNRGDVMKEEKITVNKVDEFTKQINRLQKKIQTYEDLAEAVRSATVIDRSIYTGEGDSDWLSIDRDDFMHKSWRHSPCSIYGNHGNNTIPSRITK